MLDKSKLISLLRTLKSRELRSFEEYISSPFFNKNTQVLSLFDILKPLAPTYTGPKLETEAVFNKLFGKEALDEQRLRYVMTDLTKLLEDFLAYLEYSDNEVYQKHLLLNQYYARGLDKYFESTLDGAKALQNRSPHRDVDWYFHTHLIDEDAYTQYSRSKPRIINSLLQQAADNLDLYFLSNKLRYSCAIFNRADLLQEKYTTYLLEDVLQYLESYPDARVPAIGIYYHILLTYKNDEPNKEEHYQNAKELLWEHSGLFSHKEQKDMYTHILNFCIKGLNTGPGKYLSELYELYVHLLDKDILLENGFMSPSDFKNIVAVGLRQGEVAWTEEFLHNFKDRVSPQYREAAYTYNLAFLLHNKGDFSKALRLLQTVELNDVYFHLDSKVLLLKTYYELDETEPFYSLTDAFSNYIKRNKQISTGSREVYLNFVRFARKLMNSKLGGKASNVELKEAIGESTGVASSGWLLQKVDELLLPKGKKQITKT